LRKIFYTNVNVTNCSWYTNDNGVMP